MTCGKADTDLSGSTPFVDLAALARLLAWSAVTSAALYVLRHPAQALQGLMNAALTAASAVLGVSRCVIACSVRRAALSLLVAYALSFLLPEKTGSALRRGMVAIASRTPKVILELARLAWRALMLIVEGRPDGAKQGKKPK